MRTTSRSPTTELSNKLLAEAGYGSGLTIRGYYNNTTMGQAIAEAAKGMLAKVGVDWRVGLMAPAAPATRIQKMDYDLAQGGWTFIYDPDLMATIVLIYLLVVLLPVFPLSGYVPFSDDWLANIRAMVLSTFVLGTYSGGLLARYVREPARGAWTGLYRDRSRQGILRSGGDRQHALTDGRRQRRNAVALRSQVDRAFACEEMIPTIAAEGLADAVDAFCETIAFSPEQTARVLAAACQLGLPVRLHADQLSNLHGAALAAEFGALSADHLEYADEAGIAAMKVSGTVAVVLPGSFYFIREHQRPPIDAMRRHGVSIAPATTLRHLPLSCLP